MTITVELDIGVDDPGKDSQVQETVQLSIPEGVQDSGPTVGDHSTQREMQWTALIFVKRGGGVEVWAWAQGPPPMLC